MNQERISELYSFVDQVRLGQIPDKFPLLDRGFETRQYCYEPREICMNLGMYGIVDEEFAGELAMWIGERVALEVMAGNGWLAKGLASYGVNIIATDNYSWTKDKLMEAKPVFDVQQWSATDAIQMFTQAEVLIISWPHYEDETVLLKVLELWGAERPIVYIGEVENGCCAPNSFFRAFEYQHLGIKHPSWPGIGDSAYVGYYKGSK